MLHNNNITVSLDDEAATLACGAHFAKLLLPGLVVYLHGDLGAGKTTFVRGVLRGLGYIGKVKSPTYTLVESYPVNSSNIELNVDSNYTLYHYDLYRFIDEEEWEAAGFRDYFNPHSICMIEWPEKAGQLLPVADIDVHLSIINVSKLKQTRKISFNANSSLGRQCLQKQ
jgi:tRNA threonylcarbamoyladenosine biosynthesis protein TsaE